MLFGVVLVLVRSVVGSVIGLCMHGEALPGVLKWYSMELLPCGCTREWEGSWIYLKK